MKMGKFWLGIVVLVFIVEEICTATNHTDSHNKTLTLVANGPVHNNTLKAVENGPVHNNTPKAVENGPVHNNTPKAVENVVHNGTSKLDIVKPVNKPSKIPLQEIISHPNPVVQKMRNQIARLTKQTEMLVRKTKKLDQITKEKLDQCKNKIRKLNEDEKKELSKAHEIVKSLYRLLTHLNAEEKLHVKLESEVKKVSRVIQLHKLKYEIVYGNWKLLENRRLSKTNDRCREIIYALNASNKTDMNDRAGQFLENIYRKRRPSNSNLTDEFITTEITLIKKKIGYEKASRAHERMISLNKIVNENCELETQSTLSIIQTTNKAALTAEKSKKIIQEDLKKSRELSDILRLEIREGERIIGEFKEKLIELRRKTEGYKEDVKCYKKIEAMD